MYDTGIGSYESEMLFCLTARTRTLRTFHTKNATIGYYLRFGGEVAKIFPPMLYFCHLDRVKGWFLFDIIGAGESSSGNSAHIYIIYNVVGVVFIPSPSGLRCFTI